MPNVTVGKHYDTMALSMVESGRYGSVSEVHREGLRLIEEREQARLAKLDALRRLWDEGKASGEPQPIDFQQLRQEARERLSETAVRAD